MIKISDLFDIKAVLTSKQVYALQQAGEIPAWMSVDTSSASAAQQEGDAIEFDYSGSKEEVDDGTEGKNDVTGFSRRAAYTAATAEESDGEVAIDDI